MYWTRSGDLIIMVVLGGMGSPFGPLFGAVALLVFEEVLPFVIKLVGTPFFGEAAARASEYWQIIMGPLLLLVVLFARGGIDGLLAKVGAKVRHERAAAAGQSSGQALRRHRRHRRSRAQCRRRRIACGDRAERRRQDHADRPAQRPGDARLRPHPCLPATTSPRCRCIAAARSGLARSFQITSLFLDLSVLDNVALAVQAHAGHSFRFWRDARREDGIARAGARGARPRRLEPSAPTGRRRP